VQTSWSDGRGSVYQSGPNTDGLRGLKSVRKTKIYKTGISLKESSAGLRNNFRKHCMFDRTLVFSAFRPFNNLRGFELYVNSVKNERDN
jgi:hypothetical protein